MAAAAGSTGAVKTYLADIARISRSEPGTRTFPALAAAGAPSTEPASLLLYLERALDLPDARHTPSSVACTLVDRVKKLERDLATALTELATLKHERALAIAQAAADRFLPQETRGPDTSASSTDPT